MEAKVGAKALGPVRVHTSMSDGPEAGRLVGGQLRAVSPREGSGVAGT